MSLIFNMQLYMCMSVLYQKAFTVELIEISLFV